MDLIEIKVDSRPALLEDNYDAIKQELEAELEKYDIVVTQETVKDAKNLAAKLNKVADHIDKRRKEEVAAVSEPIKQFDERMKGLVQLCKDGYQKIKKQTEQFENETKEQVRQLLDEHREELWETFQVADKYKRAEFDDLILLSNITGKGDLTKGAKEKIESRVREDLAVQEKVKMRLLQLENASYKAGLSSPLTEQHVKHVLQATDEVYETELEKLLAVEVEREQAAQKKMQERADREAEQREKARQAEEIRKANADDNPPPTTEQIKEARQIMDEQPVHDETAPPTPPKVADDRVAWEVTMKIWVSAPLNITGDYINQSMTKNLNKIGIEGDSIISVQARQCSK